MAARVVAKLRGVGEDWEVWWGGEHIGTEATHTKYVRFFWPQNWDVTVSVPREEVLLERTHHIAACRRRKKAGYAR